ncbi:amidase [Tuwongella immobilis]|uniref:Amidase domain-containing protein n=1 Tax=Tuwongella immobilis TaxID=692036 RepID=A0A6C2YT81_9BACT|nr:amidase [Tuwongella immobilis]VIP04125.1 amidase : Amidase OS=Candidatus Entotheonella sp. TSY1 GN=ETSY1_29640 PE=4 SV=1: Amidase [Tuwongella immobilis]VTS05615.1 amidase : Amidase OS=Candidatus Entotheonella sp. TSY1 GN=ETSY1_29640 PE=4 SV=1: Amidase [Tuwongella immobilis]
MRAITRDDRLATIRTLAEQIRTRKLSPVALTQAYLDALDQEGRALNAVVTLMRDTALAEAKAAEAEIAAGKYRGLLHGIPYAAKDLLATRDAPTTWGAEPYRKQQFDFDATIIQKLRQAGAILLGKLAMIELAGGFGYSQADASFTGPTKNPWNRSRWAGGSSSGSGAATAAGLAAFTIGSETSGSILCPSAFCGVTGLRPTPGRVSRMGAMPLSWTLDKIGPMARSADDCAIVLEAISGPDAADPTTSPTPWRDTPITRTKEQPWKFALIAGSIDRVHPEIKQQVTSAMTVLESFGKRVADFAWPRQPFNAAVSLLIGVEAASSFEKILKSGECQKLRDPGDRLGGYAGALIPGDDYLRALRLCQKWRQWFVQAMDDRFDVLVAPSMVDVASPIAEDDEPNPGYRGPAVIQGANLVGLPAIAVPIGVTQSGLPTSM